MESVVVQSLTGGRQGWHQAYSVPVQVAAFGARGELSIGGVLLSVGAFGADVGNFTNQLAFRLSLAALARKVLYKLCNFAILDISKV